VLRFIHRVASQFPGVDSDSLRPVNISDYRWNTLGDLTDAFDFSNPALPAATSRQVVFEAERAILA
jgi:hypothetical protein